MELLLRKIATTNDGCLPGSGLVRGVLGGGHSDWQTCPKCRESFPGEIYVDFGTNEYSFVKLENPPAYEPTHCDGCGVVIKLSDGGCSQGPKGTLCEKCTRKAFPLRG